MEKISDIIKFNSFEKGGSIEKQKEAFEQGKKMYQEGKFHFSGVKTFWVKTKVKKTIWNNWLSWSSSYCLLQEDKDGVWVGFLVANQILYGCEECDDEEARKIDLYRRVNNLHPFPLKEVKQPLKLL